MEKDKRTQQRVVRLWLAAAALIAVGLACTIFGEEEPRWIPEQPTQYTAEVQPATEVYVLIDEAGNVVDFDQAYTYGVNARMRYVLRFWDVGNQKDAYGAATISRVYTPIRITAINTELEEDLSAEQKADIYARTNFSTSEVILHNLTFSGGPQGKFIGTNSETGNSIYGYMEWREKESEMHAVFTEDIKQDYLVIADEPFYNWP